MDERNSQDRFLDQGMKEKSEGDVMHGYQLHQIPI
jgi:hypothetical protein